MDLELTETQTLIRDTARKFARERVAPQARGFDKEEHFPVELFKELASLGLMGVNIPAQYGGAEAGVVSYALAMMEMAAACASTSVAMAVTNMCAELIHRFGTEAQREKYVTRLTSGEAVVGAFALSEPHAGSDPGALRTTAVRRGDKWVLNGSKQWITSGAYAGVMVVWARTGGSGNKGL
ncbi:MAG TPA: acyl-CoA dehydrogenase family protein, partial [Myxococcaceae bacterium]|nr:acyl-CoA dehydrogenase family protein [Myxococcaceae bacterium]